MLSQMQEWRSWGAARGFTIVLDHPFLYAIRDDDTGELLFIGTLMDPPK